MLVGGSNLLVGGRKEEKRRLGGKVRRDFNSWAESRSGTSNCGACARGEVNSEWEQHVITTVLTVLPSTGQHKSAVAELQRRSWNLCRMDVFLSHADLWGSHFPTRTTAHESTNSSNLSWPFRQDFWAVSAKLWVLCLAGGDISCSMEEVDQRLPTPCSKTGRINKVPDLVLVA